MRAALAATLTAGGILGATITSAWPGGGADHRWDFLQCHYEGKLGQQARMTYDNKPCPPPPEPHVASE